MSWIAPPVNSNIKFSMRVWIKIAIVIIHRKIKTITRGKEKATLRRTCPFGVLAVRPSCRFEDVGEKQQAQHVGQLAVGWEVCQLIVNWRQFQFSREIPVLTSTGAGGRRGGGRGSTLYVITDRVRYVTLGRTMLVQHAYGLLAPSVVWLAPPSRNPILISCQQQVDSRFMKNLFMRCVEIIDIYVWCRSYLDAA
jgi:hypothetical protein